MAQQVVPDIESLPDIKALVDRRAPAKEVIAAIEAKGLVIPPNIRQILISKLPASRQLQYPNYPSYPDIPYTGY